MVPIERDVAALVPGRTTASATATHSAAAAIVSPAHTLDIHSCSQLLSVGIL
jgi:hypothetical protein